jgi:hypothetical protein
MADSGAGFLHTSIIGDGSCGIVSLPCYNDAVVNDYFQPNTIDGTTQGYVGGNYLCFLWNRESSLNNDMSRQGVGESSTSTTDPDTNEVTTSSSGTQSAFLKFKKISNLRISNNTYYDYSYTPLSDTDDNILSSRAKIVFYGNDEPVLEKVDDKIYYGVVDKAMTSETDWGSYFIGCKSASNDDFSEPSLLYPSSSLLYVHEPNTLNRWYAV